MSNIFIVICLDEDRGKQIYFQSTSKIFETEEAANIYAAEVNPSRLAKVISRPRYSTDEVYVPFVPSHKPYACKIVLTRAQRVAIKRKWDQSSDKAMNYLEFRRRVIPEIGKSGCVMLPWCGMWIGIETDGHAHS